MALSFTSIFLFVFGLLAGGALAAFYFFSRSKVHEEKLSHQESLNSKLESSLGAKKEYIAALHDETTSLKEKNIEHQTLLEEERKRSEEKGKLLELVKASLSDNFKALSSEVLEKSQSSFLNLAKASFEKLQEKAHGDLDKKHHVIAETLKPLETSLNKVNGKIEELDKLRATAYGGITEQIRSLIETQSQLKLETSNLVKALRSPIVRGRWGEIQLKRVVEMAGMLEHCDFLQQESVTTEDGRLRPDMVITLPNEKQIVIDAKAPLHAYLEALESKDEDSKIDNLRRHARHIRTHVSQLSAKNYWAQFKPAPEFVILFIPGEVFFSAALEHDPALIEFGAEKQVIVATPTTLIALLRAVAYGWQQDNVAKNAHDISELGKSLYDRLRTMTSHFSDMKKGLEKAVEGYNKAVGSFESRVLCSARKFKELGSETAKEIPAIEPIETLTRSLHIEHKEEE
jgi:DNA recombination protein RmuC